MLINAKYYTQIISQQEQDTKLLGQSIAKIINNHAVIALTGPVGAGKTTLVKYILQQYSDEKLKITSPTFTIANNYNINNIDYWHFDLYRLTNVNDIWEIGIEEALNDAVTFIEWPEIFINYLPIDTIFIDISADYINKNITISSNNAKIFTDLQAVDKSIKIQTN